MGLSALALMMADLFLYGTLRHAPLLAVVLGRDPVTQKARLAGHQVGVVAGRTYPMLVVAAGMAEGLLLAGASASDLARLSFYEAGYRLRDQPVCVTLAGGVTRAARVFEPEPGSAAPDGVWSLGHWQRTRGEMATLAAREYMAAFGTGTAANMARRYPMMLVRAASRIRARSDPAPTALRHSQTPDDVVVDGHSQPYAHFFAVEEYDLRHRRFDGTVTRPLNRATFVSGDAAVVLPYDPVLDRVMIVEQFRPGPFARGDRQSWQLEPIAGRIDPGETPEQAARREAVEEAGIVLGELLPVGNFYPSPGAKTEYLYSYVGIADLSDSRPRLAGLAEEGEDIRAHVLSFDALLALVASGEVATAPLLMTAYWLEHRRAALRAAALRATALRTAGSVSAAALAQPPAP